MERSCHSGKLSSIKNRTEKNYDIVGQKTTKFSMGFSTASLALNSFFAESSIGTGEKYGTGG